MCCKSFKNDHCKLGKRCEDAFGTQFWYCRNVNYLFASIHGAIVLSISLDSFSNGINTIEGSMWEKIMDFH